MSQREEILARVSTISALPTSATQMLALANNPDAQIEDVQRTVEYDPGLVTNLLRLANSAYFGTGGAINSVREAVVRLGFKRVFQIAMTSAVAPIAQKFADTICRETVCCVIVRRPRLPSSICRNA